MGIIQKIAAEAGFQMQKYNENHGPDGKFTSGGSGGSYSQVGQEKKDGVPTSRLGNPKEDAIIGTHGLGGPPVKAGPMTQTVRTNYEDKSGQKISVHESKIPLDPNGNKYFVMHASSHAGKDKPVERMDFHTKEEADQHLQQHGIKHSFTF